MYYKANDSELIYLIKDGNLVAKRVLYEKYCHLIKKIYYDTSYCRTLIYLDFQQECLMRLEQAIFSYEEGFACSFYTYFTLVIRRLTYKLLRNDALKVKERNVEYTSFESFRDACSESKILRIIGKEFQKEPLEERNILEYCFLRNCSLAAFTRKFELNYFETYPLYKKVQKKLEKILTNFID